MARHIALIPARKGSTGIPRKNPIFFGVTADFIDSSGLFDEVVVSTNDEEMVQLAEARGYKVRLRPDTIARSTDPIKPTLEDVIANLDLKPDDYIWLFYITFVYRDIEDFKKAKALVLENQPTNLLVFIPVVTHPFRCWGYNPETGKMYKYIEDPRVNRQEYPPAWSHHHYLCAVRVGSMDKVNGNLIGPDTLPVFFSEEEGAKLVDLDEYADIEDWLKRYPQDYAKWWQSQPEGKRIGPEPLP